MKRVLSVVAVIAIAGLLIWVRSDESVSEDAKNALVAVGAISRGGPASAGLVKSGSAAVVPNGESAENFQRLVLQASESLPRVEALRGMSDPAMHHTPEIVLAAAENLGQLAEFLENHPEHKSAAAEFYQGCAQDSDGVASIRALCLHRVESVSRELGRRVDDDLYAAIPESVRELSRFLE